MVELDEICSALERGDPVVLPTDTVYGLCALPEVEGAVERVFELKGRTRDTPIAVLCADADQALALSAEPSDAHRRVAAACWPGPLTLVLHRREGLDWDLGEPAGTIGLRCPDHDLLQAIIARLGPIAATSANRHGQPPPHTTDEIRSSLGEDVLLVDGGKLDGAASTVVDATGPTWSLLREGVLARRDLDAAGAPLG